MNGKGQRTLFFISLSIFICMLHTTLLAQRHGPGPGAGPGVPVSTALTNFETEFFSGSGVCALCHSSLTDSKGNDVSNDAHWRSTMMGNAAKDPLWQAKIESEVNRNPHLQEVIEEKCSRCHMGMARYQALADGTVVGVLNNGFLDNTHPLNPAAMDGVSCTLCHQIQPDNLGSESSFTGKYSVDLTRMRPDRAIFGPYDFPVVNPMRNNSGFIPTHGPQTKDSAMCGSCHTLYTPTVDEWGNVVGEFPEQMTYLEWEHSGMAQTCQNCHLPAANGPVAISNRPRRLAPRSPFGQHHFVGGNNFMIDVLKNNDAELGITADPVHLDETIARTMAQLKEKTGTLTASSTTEEDSFKVNVVVTNLTGHKFPSGFPSRRTWLYVTVTDGFEEIIFESGRPLSNGQIEGNDADMDSTTFEPHYDEITNRSEVQLYEAVMRNTQDEVTWTLLSAASYAKDNRLLPLGFDKGTAGPDFSVRGDAEYDDNFYGGQDQVTYVVDTIGETGPFTMTIDLLFQSVSYPFVANLRADGTSLVNRFADQYDLADKMPVVIDTAQIIVP